MSDTCTFTPTGGSQINLNSGDFKVGYGVQLGAKKTEFDEVRSYTGAIRQVDIHQPLVDMVIPVKVTGSNSDDLWDDLVLLKSACVTGGSLTWQPNGEPSQVFTIGCSPEPEVTLDPLYKLKTVALVELHLHRLP